MSSRKRGLRAIVWAGAVIGSMIVATGGTPAGGHPVTTPAPACAGRPTLPGAPGMAISNPNCDDTITSGVFAPLDGSRVWAGTIVDRPAGGVTLPGGDGGGGRSGYRVEVPAPWNGTLVMFAHGYAGNGRTVAVTDPDLRQWFVDHGYAWAASSYAMNGYDVGTGVIDSHDLLTAFPSITGLRPTRVIMSGLSMGGAITMAEIEHYRNTFAGAMPYCGVLGGNDLFNYFLGANVTAAALTTTHVSFPTAADSAGYAPTYDALVLNEVPELGIGSSTGLTARGRAWKTAVEYLSGGIRPGFDRALAYWDSFGFAPLTNIPFLFGLYPGLTGGGLGFLKWQRDRRRGRLLPVQRPGGAQRPDVKNAERPGAAGGPHRTLIDGPNGDGAARPHRHPGHPGRFSARHRRPLRAVLHGPGLRPPRR